MKSWNKLPDFIRCEEVKPYYRLVKSKWFYRFIKRLFDIIASLILMMILLLPSIVIGIVIISTSKGGPLYLQKRVGRYGKSFYIFKFRTMVKDSEGNQHITHKNDARITKAGVFLRKTHLDEFPQLINVFIGQMSFVGTRPEVKQFVDLYEKEWYATLLMRPGVTSTAAYSGDDETKFLDEENADKIYLKELLPQKMKKNLKDLYFISFWLDIKILWKTLF